MGQDEGGLISEWGKKRSQLMQRRSLITSHQQTDAQPFFKQQLSTKSPCFIEEHDVYGVKYPWAVWISCPLPASCVLPGYSWGSRARNREGLGAVQALLSNSKTSTVLVTNLNHSTMQAT